MLNVCTIPINLRNTPKSVSTFWRKKKKKKKFNKSSIFQRKAKKALGKKKLFTPNEKTKIAEEFKMMKSVLLDKSGKNAKDNKGL